MGPDAAPSEHPDPERADADPDRDLTALDEAERELAGLEADLATIDAADDEAGDA